VDDPRACLFAWLFGFATVAPVGASYADVHGTCVPMTFFPTQAGAVAYRIWNGTSVVAMPVILFLYCYGRIICVVRRQSRIFEAQFSANGAPTVTSSRRPASRRTTSVAR